MTGPEVSDDQDRIDFQASEWVVLMSDRTLTGPEAEAFEAWLLSDPRHGPAWQSFEAVWATIPALDGLAADVSFIDEPVSPILPRRWRLAPRALAAVAASITVLVGALTMTNFVPSAPQSFQTGLSESRLITLQDGTKVTLGPRSDLTVRFKSGERRVALAAGEAFFEVVHDAREPFYVEAGGAQTKVLGTKFDVNYASASVRVGVLQGVVQVSRIGGTPTSSQNSAYVTAGHGAEVALDRQAPIVLHADTAVGAWRDGRLIYENARLADVAADANRYYAPGVELANRETGHLRITASFKPSEIGAFMSAIDKVVPVSATATAAGGFRLAKLQQ